MSSALPWISIGIALLALSVNALTFMDRRRQDRRDLFLKMHERMIDPDLQEGRWVVHALCATIADVKSLSTTDRDAFKLANRALAMFDAFAIYIEHGYIDEKVALEEWGYATANFYGASRAFLEYRSAEAGREAWSNFQKFGREATKWREKRELDGGIPY